MTKIRFGTDGWRGRMAEDYTFANLRRCAQGFANWLADEGHASQTVVVGHDKRFQSEHFAAARRRRCWPPTAFGSCSSMGPRPRP